MSPIRPENRARYGTAAEWREVRRRILVRAGGDPDVFDDPLPVCECRGECGRLHRDGRCDHVHGLETARGTRVVLTIAHLDHTPEHNADENLRAMCQGCHLHYDREHHAHTRMRTRREELERAGQGRLL